MKKLKLKGRNCHEQTTRKNRDHQCTSTGIGAAIAKELAVEGAND